MSLAALAAAVVVPPVYVTEIYGFTFEAPRGAYYCPLPEDWIGSDHGTIVFLERPSSCVGAGYPSSSRSFEPQTAPRISIYYSYSMEPEDRPPPEPCQALAGFPTMQWFGQTRRICRSEQDGFVVLTIQAAVGGKPPRDLSVRLVTPREPTYGEFMTFLSLATSIRSCGEAGAVRTACPAGERF